MRLILIAILLLPMLLLEQSCKPRQQTSLSESKDAGPDRGISLQLNSDGAVVIAVSDKYSSANSISIRFRRGSAFHKQEWQCPQSPKDTTFINLPVDAASRTAKGPIPPTMWLKSPYEGFDPNSLTKFSKSSFEALKNGGDALVDVCIWNQGSVAATTTLPFDGSQEFDQLIAGNPQFYHGGRDVVLALVEGDEQPKGDPRTRDPNNVLYVPDAVGKAPTLAEYVAQCEKEIGPIPVVDCSQASVIETYETVANGSYYDNYGRLQNNYVRYIVDNDYFKNSPVGATDASSKCDSPAMLGYGNYNQCAPYSRVSSPRVSGKGQWAFVCRRYYGRPKADPHFDDVNMIGHNPQTGATCFFNSKLNPSAPQLGYDLGRDTTRIPKLNDSDATSFWMAPSEVQRAGCAHRCHNNDPFIHTPFIDRYNKAGLATNTCINDSGASNCLVPSNPNGPYKIVFDSYLNWAPQILKPVSELEACTSCHRVGARSYISFSLQAGVRLMSSGHAPASFRAWMPPGGQIDDAAKKALDYLQKCYDAPKSCETQPVSQ